MLRVLRALWAEITGVEEPIAPAESKRISLTAAQAKPAASKYAYPIQAPVLHPGVVPPGLKPAVAMDNAYSSLSYGYANSLYGGVFAGFPGYPYLSYLTTRAEYRAMADALSTELTREWIVLNSTGTEDDSTAGKIVELTQAIKDFKVKECIRRAASHDALFGCGQIYLDLKGKGANYAELPLVVSDKTIGVGSLIRFSNVEPIWVTPNAYNASDPAAADFYKPTTYWMLGRKIHTSRMLRIITRELPDILKPAFNFSGMSLSQLAEPYVDNWLRTRQSVADIINNFSITALKTAMQQVMSGVAGAGQNLIDRATLFTLNRNNQGLMLMDKDAEDLVQINTPLGGLHELQAQSQEHMCAVSRMPAIILTGISPGGLNASSDSEIRAFYDWIAAQQEAYYRFPIETMIKIIQLHLYGKIDPNISFTFEPLYQMTPKELAEIRTADAASDASYVGCGAIDAGEVRAKLARDPESGYQGIELDVEIDTGVLEDVDEDED